MIVLSDSLRLTLEEEALRRGLTAPILLLPRAPETDPLANPETELRGGVKALWESQDFETIVSGPAETGKTWGCLHYTHALLRKYPGAHAVMLRKTYSALVGSAMRTFKRIVGDGLTLRPYGGEKPEWYDYPNGSRLWVAGLDNPGKALSSERDFFYVNQAEELTLEDWEILSTRCTGRGSVMPFTRLFGDCNPGSPHHWIKKREGLRLLESRHTHNPTLYDLDGNLTEQGIRTMAVLDNLTGVRRARLRDGKWVSAEGQVYEQWDAEAHLIDRMPRGWEEWPRYRSTDFGFSNPFCMLWGATDPDGRLYIYRELYHTQRTVKRHAAQIRDVSEGESYVCTVADHDAEDRETLREEGIPTVPARKEISPGIQAVQERLQPAGDGKPRLFVLRSALIERDESLEDSKRPYCLAQEFDAYVWPKGADGKALKEKPVDADNHGLDALRYLVMRLEKRRAGNVYLA